MTRAPFSLLLSLILLLLTGLPAAPVSNVCPAGTCDITDPIFVNVYWDTSEAQWNNDIAANDASATVRRIDALTAAICHSNYFTQLHQYDIHSCSVQPSIVETGCGPIPSDLNQAHDLIGDFASCVISNHPALDPSRTILNVLLPPQVLPNYFIQNWCIDPSRTNGEHDKYGSPVAVTFIPTTSLCNTAGMTGIQSITAVLTHEMVEATTDPNPASITGWKVAFGDEVADQCENKKPRANQFLYGMISLYFADNLDGCTTSGVGSPPPPPVPTPDSAAVTACGSGKHMRLTISGTSIDPAPWDLVNNINGGSRTLFLQGSVKSKFSAGGFWNFPQDTVGFGPISWTSNLPDLGPTCAGKCNLSEQTCMNGAHSFSDRKQCIAEKKNCTAQCPAPPSPVSNQIIIHGFDNNYAGAGQVVSPGDTIAITVTGWKFGDVTVGSVTVPGPDQLLNASVTNPFSGWISVGDHATVFGKFVDVGGCPVGAMGVQLSASDADPKPVSPTSPTTNDDGTFSAQYTPSGPAGIHTVSIAAQSVMKNIAVPVHPVAASLSESLGLAAGGQALTLTGDGFDAAAGATKILFQGPKTQNLATVVGVPNLQTVSLLTPPSPLGSQNSGWVQVAAIVNGQPSQSLPYLFFVPNQPILSFGIGCAAQVRFASFRVDAYGSNGKPASEQITLSAAFPAFMSGGQKVSNLTVPAGATVLLNGLPPYPGPFTATPSAGSNLAVTEGFPANAPTSNCEDPAAKYIYQVISYFPGPDPIENVVTQPIIAGQSVVWSNAAAQENATAFIAVNGAARTDANVEVRILGARDLASVTNERPFGFTRQRSDAAGHVRLLGPNFSVTAPPSAVSKAWSAPALISFRLPDGANASEYAIIHSAPGARSWAEVASVPTKRYTQRFVRANISEMGTYALARLELLRR